MRANQVWLALLILVMINTSKIWRGNDLSLHIGRYVSYGIELRRIFGVSAAISCWMINKTLLFDDILLLVSLGDYEV